MRKGRDLLLDMVALLIGGTLYASAICIFIQPNALVTGGFSGIAIVLNRLFSLPTGISIFVLNVPLFLIGYKQLGKGYILKTTAATAVCSALIELFSLLPPFRCERILAAIAGGILAGAGLALIFIRGASTGGTDLIGMLICTKRPHLPLGKLIMCFDAGIIFLSAVVFRGIENALYSALMIGISGAAVDYFIYGAKSAKLLLIITEKSESISRQINRIGRRGATILPATGAYTGKRRDMILVAVKPNELGKMYRIISENDEKAFTALVDAGDIKGLGFYKKI